MFSNIISNMEKIVGNVAVIKRAYGTQRLCGYVRTSESAIDGISAQAWTERVQPISKNQRVNPSIPSFSISWSTYPGANLDSRPANLDWQIMIWSVASHT